MDHAQEAHKIHYFFERTHQNDMLSLVLKVYTPENQIYMINSYPFRMIPILALQWPFL